MAVYQEEAEGTDPSYVLRSDLCENHGNCETLFPDTLQTERRRMDEAKLDDLYLWKSMRDHSTISSQGSNRD